MGCRKLTYNQAKGTNPFLGIWKEGGCEKLPFLKGSSLTKKDRPLKKRDSYYPFGLSINALSSTAPLSKPNRFKLSGNEHQTEFDWNVYDFNARTYDPILGRFMQIDPMSEKREWLNPYNYVQNNPLIRVDPEGTEDWYTNENGDFTYDENIKSQADLDKAGIKGTYQGVKGWGGINEQKPEIRFTIMQMAAQRRLHEI